MPHLFPGTQCLAIGLPTDGGFSELHIPVPCPSKLATHPQPLYTAHEPTE